MASEKPLGKAKNGRAENDLYLPGQDAEPSSTVCMLASSQPFESSGSPFEVHHGLVRFMKY